MIANNDLKVEQPVYDGLDVQILEVAPQGVLCGSAAQADGLTVTGHWMSTATDL